MLSHLPLNALKDDVCRALSSTPLLLEAEPGAGKSTLVPLWVLEHTEAPLAVWLVEPRILAAQALAQRLAWQLGEKAGETVGYQVAYDRCIGSNTRLVVMTPGVLLQRLLADPTLEGVGAVIIDEVHERGVNQDVAWAFLQEAQILRDDLRLILMSATPDPALAAQIPHRLFAEGRCFSVSVAYLPPKPSTNHFPERLADHVVRALAAIEAWQQKTILVFLPGWKEIDDTANAIRHFSENAVLFRLHSRVDAAEQQRALNPDEGPRIILSTTIAETSLTIADVTVVIDSGLVRRADYEQRTGLSRLRTARVSAASAEQRRGRAGRVQAGHCIRLWSQDQPLAAADLPEIRATDYVPLALMIAHWGTPAAQLPWLEAPNPLGLAHAQQQLQRMGFIDEAGSVTARGERVSELGTHPRVAAFLLGHEQTMSEASLTLALALHFGLEGDDVSAWMEAAARERQRNRHWRKQESRWQSELSLKVVSGEVDKALLAMAFSDRIGYRQASGKYRLNSGISVSANIDSPWAILPVIRATAKSHEGIGFSLSLSRDAQRQLADARAQLQQRGGRWGVKRQWVIGAEVVDEAWEALAPEQIPAALAVEAKTLLINKPLAEWPLGKATHQLLSRAQLAAKYELITIPSLDEATLLANIDEWLVPFLSPSSSLDNLPWKAALEFYLGFDTLSQLDTLLPEKITLPSGRDVFLEFTSEGEVQVSAKLQEFFGCEHLPFPAATRLPLKIHLLSPNGSPLAITSNLKTFWQQGYPDVRKDMRGRYPRHPWPENPLEHEATALTKRKLAAQTQKPT